MTVRNSALRYLVLSAFFMAFFCSCTEKYLMVGSGVLKGKITIGPLCPVERIPPDPACLPTQDTYKNWATAVWTLNKKTKLATLNPNLDGNYQLEIPAGNYLIDFEFIHPSGVGGSNLPAAVYIAGKDTTVFNVSIDTGIR
jgi:hypothetical protein